MAIATGRAGNVIGGGDWALDRLIPDFFRALNDGRALDVRFPNATRPWQHVLEPLSGYLLLACNAFFMLVTVPLALHYLGKERSGVWAVVSQMATYLAMIDLGTTGAGIRLLVDHKDARGDNGYGSLIKSMVFTQFIQAGLIVALGFGSVGLLQSLLKIPLELRADFNTLLIWQVIFLATNFAFRVGSQIGLAQFCQRHPSAFATRPGPDFNSPATR